MKRIIVILALIGTILPSQLYAWGHEGHSIIAQLAYFYLSPKAKTRLGMALDLTPSDAANWMDQVRSDHRYDYMKHWHYINIPEGGKYDSSQGDNIIFALKKYYAALRENRLAGNDRKEAIMILMHLMGDLHQPLHCGYGYDKGGNAVQVRYNGKGTNLHHIWDDDIIEDQKISVTSCIATGEKLTPRDIHQVQLGTFVDWMYESRAVLKQVYDFKGSEINLEYVETNKVLVEVQLLKAGIRLALALERILG